MLNFLEERIVNILAVLDKVILGYSGHVFVVAETVWKWIKNYRLF
jgi:hypothetical protein